MRAWRKLLNRGFHGVNGVIFRNDVGDVVTNFERDRIPGTNTLPWLADHYLVALQRL